MAFWTSEQSSPKRKFRFKVEITGFDGNSAVWWAKSAKKPSFTIAAAEHKYLNHTFHFPGNVTWDPCTMTLVDPAGGEDGVDAMQLLLEVIKKTGYAIPSDASDLNTITKSQGVSGTGTVKITQISGDNLTQEYWELRNAWVAKVDGGELSYGEDTLSEINIEVRYDWAVCGIGDGSGGVSNTYFDTTGA